MGRYALMLDISLEAIEADLSLAEANVGRPLERIALAKAAIRAQILAAQMIASVPVSEPARFVGTTPLDIDDEPDDDDVFAEARRARKQK